MKIYCISSDSSFDSEDITRLSFKFERQNGEQKYNSIRLSGEAIQITSNPSSAVTVTGYLIRDVSGSLNPASPASRFEYVFTRSQLNALNDDTGLRAATTDDLVNVKSDQAPSGSYHVNVIYEYTVVSNPTPNSQNTEEPLVVV